MEKYTCGVCGSEYELTSFHFPVRDKDSIECEVCGTTIKSWSSSRAWNSRLVKRGKIPPAHSGEIHTPE